MRQLFPVRTSVINGPEKLARRSHDWCEHINPLMTLWCDCIHVGFESGNQTDCHQGTGLGCGSSWEPAKLPGRWRGAWCTVRGCYDVFLWEKRAEKQPGARQQAGSMKRLGTEPTLALPHLGGLSWSTSVPSKPHLCRLSYCLPRGVVCVTLGKWTLEPFVRGKGSSVRKRVCPGKIACSVKGSSEGYNSIHGLGLA